MPSSDSDSVMKVSLIEYDASLMNQRVMQVSTNLENAGFINIDSASLKSNMNYLLKYEFFSKPISPSGVDDERGSGHD